MFNRIYENLYYALFSDYPVSYIIHYYKYSFPNLNVRRVLTDESLRHFVPLCTFTQELKLMIKSSRKSSETKNYINTVIKFNWLYCFSLRHFEFMG